MADVVQNAQQEFWRTTLRPGPGRGGTSLFHRTRYSRSVQWLRQRVYDRGKFCHSCRAWPVGFSTERAAANSDAGVMAGVWSRNVAWMGAVAASAATAWRKIPFPAWLRYLHFHEIKRWVGLPTASLIAFIIGLGCVAGALGVSFFYKASNLAEFQAIQMWRMEWLMAATASFVAGILLKTPSDND